MFDYEEAIMRIVFIISGRQRFINMLLVTDGDAMMMSSPLTTDDQRDSWPLGLGWTRGTIKLLVNRSVDCRQFDIVNPEEEEDGDEWPRNKASLAPSIRRSWLLVASRDQSWPIDLMIPSSVLITDSSNTKQRTSLCVIVKIPIQVVNARKTKAGLIKLPRNTESP